MAELLPEQLPPEQPSASNAIGSEDMALHITCMPPLGHSTTVKSEQSGVPFTVLAELPSSSTKQAKIAIWHNHGGEHDWAELLLKPTKAPEHLLEVRDSEPHQGSKQWFTADLIGLPKHGQSVSFTVKYRTGSSQPWQWIKDSTGISDGTLNYLGSTDFLKHCTSYSLDHFIDDISSDIKVEQAESETTKTQLWRLSCPIAAANGQDSGYSHHRLGKMRKSLKWFALVRLWSPWLAPRQGTSNKFELDKDGVLVSFLRSDGLHVVCLAISGVRDVLTTFIHDKHGNVEIKGRNDREESGTSRVLVAVAEDFERANCAVMYHARKVISEYGASSEVSANTNEIKSLTDSEVKPEWLEEWYDGLTYCTWNGLGQNLTAEKIEDALESLKKNGITITNLIIDDNWQSLAEGPTQFQRGWSRFEANSKGFPDGMKATTTFLRQKFSNLNHIAVWHAILGYWGGIDPNGEIAKTYKTRVVEKESGVAGGKFTVVDPSDAKRMYDDFYKFLSSSGIDSVKTDAQFFLDLLLHAPDRRQMMLEYQDAWTIAHLRHFSSRAISCMSQFPQSLFHTQLPQNKPRLLVRNSDDFFPEVEASHAWHIFCNAHNSIFTQHLNALPDWDMFQTSHDWASFHAAARCVSGGPIYFTDKPGEHDIKLIRQMTAQTPRGKTVILRPHRIGKAMDCYNAYDAMALLKVGTFVGMQQKGSGILGLFNVSKQVLKEFVHLSDIPGAEKGEYVVDSFYSGDMSGPISCEAPAAAHVTLGPRGWDILTAYAVHRFKLGSKEVQVAVLGLLDKMTGAAAVTNSDLFVASNGRLRIWTSLKALGTMGLWLSDLSDRSIDNDFMVMIFGKPIPAHCVSKRSASNAVHKDAGGVLKIDVERAWKEMELQAGWSNEVAVEVFVNPSS
jgi:hypothetical protein